ncbi:hypothetical protein V5799_030463 [Amblyomma americanum]|uniref:Carboxypeptidase Q n=1 Tax=Amblyomma americanum TaxID=6943 RepID=A0AAQ4ENG5_AMBAM
MTALIVTILVENKLVEVGPSLSVLQPASSSNALLPALQTTTIGRELPPPTMIVIQPPPFSIKLPGITPVVKVVMGAKFQTLTFSRNTVAEIKGHSYDDEVVIVGGHIDPLEVGQGAMDDGGGAFVSVQSLRVLRRLGLRPRRTVRCVLWTGEEMGYPAENATSNCMARKRWKA